jgi:hypothetical protein
MIEDLKCFCLWFVNLIFGHILTFNIPLILIVQEVIFYVSKHIIGLEIANAENSLTISTEISKKYENPGVFKQVLKGTIALD